MSLFRSLSKKPGIRTKKRSWISQRRNTKRYHQGWSPKQLSKTMWSKFWLWITAQILKLMGQIDLRGENLFLRASEQELDKFRNKRLTKSRQRLKTFGLIWTILIRKIQHQLQKHQSQNSNTMSLAWKFCLYIKLCVKFLKLHLTSFQSTKTTHFIWPLKMMNLAQRELTLIVNIYRLLDDRDKIETRGIEQIVLCNRA